MDSYEVEFQTIGSILREGKNFGRVKEILNYDSFHNSICQDIFKAMEAIHQRGHTIDQVTVADQLGRNGVTIQYDAFTDRAALSAIRGLGSKTAFESYAMTVKDYWIKRQMMNLASVVASRSANGSVGADIIADTRKVLDELSAHLSVTNDGVYNAKQAASVAYDNTEEASRGALNYVPTGLVLIDKVLRIRRKSLTIVAGRPGTGKTGFIETVALNIARDKKNSGKGKVLIVSMEMAVEEIVNRILSKICEVSATDMLDGLMDADEWERYNAAIEEYEKLPIYVIDVAGMSIQEIQRKAKSILNEGEHDFLIVDYLQLASSEQHKNRNRVEEVGAIARGLKVYASENDTPVLAAAQLSRAVEQRADPRPILSDLRESGNIEQDANNILFLYNEESSVGNDKIRGKTKRVVLAKQRSGKTSYDEGVGDIVLGWRGQFTQFTNDAEILKLQ